MDLSAGWTDCTVVDLADVFLGKTPRKTEYCSDGNFKIIKFRDLRPGYVDFRNAKDGFVLDSEKVLSSLRELRKDDVLITSAAHSGENIGKKCAIVERIPSTFRKVFFTGELLNIRALKDETLAKWIYYYFLSQDGFKEIQKAVAGVHLTSGRAQSMRIKLAPANEQHRIVAKLEKLLAKVDKCKERLDKIPAILKRFRQSVLAAACSGRLTADWREKCRDLAPASILIENIRNPYPATHLDIFEKSSNFELPESWMWVPLGKLRKLLGGGTPSKSKSQYWNGTIPWVSPNDMKKDRIFDSIDHITEDAISNSSTKIIPLGSILFVVRGMILNHTLPVAITDRPLAMNQDMKALVPAITEMKEYLLTFSKYLTQKILFAVKEATHGTR